MQGRGGSGLKGPSTVPQGEGIPIDVRGGGVDHILVTDGTPGTKPLKVPIEPGGSTTIPPQPGWTPGTVLFIYTNTTPVRGILVEIVPASE